MRRKWLLAAVLILINYFFFAALFKLIARDQLDAPQLAHTSEPSFVVAAAQTTEPSPSPLPSVVLAAPLAAEPTAAPTQTPALVPTPTTSMPTATAFCRPPADWAPYKVLPGETLNALAYRYLVSSLLLAQANCLSNPVLEANQVIFVPPAGVTPHPQCGPPSTWVRYAVQRGDTLYSLAVQTGTTVETVVAANCLSGYAIRVGQQLWLPYWPGMPANPTATVTQPTLTPTDTPSPAATPTQTPAPTPTPSASPSDTPTPSETPTETPTESPTPSPSPENTATDPLPTSTPTPS